MTTTLAHTAQEAICKVYLSWREYQPMPDAPKEVE